MKVLPYLLLTLQTLQKIGPLLVLHEVKVVRQMRQNTQKAKGKRRGKERPATKGLVGYLSLACPLLVLPGLFTFSSVYPLV